jgi:hypothetical protein
MKEAMQELAAKVDCFLNPNPQNKAVGFAVFVFPFHGCEGPVAMISNAQRESMIDLMKEYIKEYDHADGINGKSRNGAEG